MKSLSTLIGIVVLGAVLAMGIAIVRDNYQGDVLVVTEWEDEHGVTQKPPPWMTGGADVEWRIKAENPKWKLKSKKHIRRDEYKWPTYPATQAPP